MKKLIFLLAMGMVFMADAFAGVNLFIPGFPHMNVTFGRLVPYLGETTTDPSSNMKKCTVYCDLDYISEICYVVFFRSGYAVVDVNQQNGVLPQDNGYFAIDFGTGPIIGDFKAHYNAPYNGNVLLRQHTFLIAPPAEPVQINQ